MCVGFNKWKAGVAVMRAGEIITFNAEKNFTYIKPLGNGGTGDTYYSEMKLQILCSQ